MIIPVENMEQYKTTGQNPNHNKAISNITEAFLYQQIEMNQMNIIYSTILKSLS